MQERYLAEITHRFTVPLIQIPLLPHEVKGIPMLIDLGRQVYGETSLTAPEPLREVSVG